MSATTYLVDGMTCGHCVSSVTEELNAIDGVTGVEVDLESGRVVVDGDVTPEQVEAAVQEAGYSLRSS